MATSVSPWTSGNLAPVEVETTAIDLDVTGAIPDGLDGRYLRIGPNPHDPVDPDTHHWFVGDGMVHGVRLRDGAAQWYRNRWVRSPDLAGRMGEAPPANPYGPDVGVIAANTNVIGHAGRVLACVEGGFPPIELTPELDTAAVSDLDGTLEFAFSAHPKRDPVTGALHVMAYWWGWGDQVRYLVVDASGHVVHHTDIDVGAPVMIHDLAITATRALVLDLPVTFRLEAAMGGSTFPYRWDDDRGARVGVLPLGGSADEVVWCDVDPCWVFHPLNAHDLPDGRIVMDLVRWPRVFSERLLGPGEGRSRLERWTIDPAARTVKEETLDDRQIEFPRHDERRLGRHVRYGYAVTLERDEESFLPAAAVKYDLDTGASEPIDTGPGRTPGELVFVPRTPDAAEDDGWLMTFVHDRTTDRSDFVIWSAQGPTSGPVATVHLPVRVPDGFHGNWVAD